MGLVETKIGGLWWAKQSARGVAATTADKRGRQATGTVATNRQDGSEKIANDDRFGDAEHFVDSIAGQADFAVLGQAGICAHLAYLIAGQETCTTIQAGDATVGTSVIEHVATPAAQGGFYATMWQKVGEADYRREKFVDNKISRLAIEASTSQKVARATISAPGLDPGEKFVTDPVKAMDIDPALLYTEGEGAFKVNGQVVRGHIQLNATIDEGITPFYTDAVTPLELAPGDPSVSLALAVALNTEGMAIYNREVYGTTAPAVGAKPVKTLPPIGSYEALLVKGTAIVLTVGGTGTYTLTVDGQVTAAIAQNANAATLRGAIEALPNVEPGDVLVTGTGPYAIAFIRSGVVVSANSTGLTGGTAVPTNNGAWRSLKVEVAGIKWTPGDAPAPNPTGGAAQLSISGALRRVAGSPAWRITTRTADAAYS